MPYLTIYLLVAASWWNSVAGDKFDQCKVRFERILNGTEVYGTFNNETIRSSGIIYNGFVRGMNPEFAKMSRDQFLTVTTDGCRAICGESIDWYWSSDVGLSLGIISNWILPILALLAAFPFDSIHKRHGKLRAIWATMRALFNWLGSPQLALTTILFSIWQNLICSWAATTGASSNVSTSDRQLMELQALENAAATDASSSGSLMKAQAHKNAYYVVCCMSQYKLQDVMNTTFLEKLVYGLIRPEGIGEMTRDQEQNESPLGLERRKYAQQWTTELLEAMASQLRALRRRGVYPAFVSIFLFCIAYAISLVMAFANIGDRTTTHSLAVGILISWLPNLLLFAIIDRNPISAERSRALFIRWISNVAAVKEWENSEHLLSTFDFESGHLKSDIELQQYLDSKKPQWWSQENQRWSEESPDFPLGEFIGQGREIGFNGLADAVAHGMRKGRTGAAAQSNLNGPEGDSLLRAEPLNVAGSIKRRLTARPGSWWCCSLVSLVLVWWEISMAFMLSFSIPTIGIGCRSASYLIYGVLSTIPWLINTFPSRNPGNPGEWRKRFSMGFCMLSTFCLLFILFAAFSGVLKNCWCRGGFSRYLDFENARFYRDKDHFNVAAYWKAAAVVGAFPILLSFFAAWIMLREIKPLRQESVQSNLSRNPQRESVQSDLLRKPQRADTAWLS